MAHGLSSDGAIAAIVRGVVGIGWVPLIALPFAGWPGAGLAIGLCYGAQFVPAAIEAWRAGRLEGLSPATWTLAFVEAGAWLVYGALTTDPALIVGGGGGAVMSGLILVRIMQVTWERRWPTQLPSAVLRMRWRRIAGRTQGGSMSSTGRQRWRTVADSMS